MESLVRLSEGMARAHCDHVVKPDYVREAVRLMKTSNINIVKGDVVLDDNDIQEDINRMRQEERILLGAGQMVSIINIVCHTNIFT